MKLLEIMIGSSMKIADLILKNKAPIFVLSYFDALIGPHPLKIYPENLKESLKDDTLQNIASHMDVHKVDEIFQICYGNSRINALNLIFTLHSEWARGMQEVCMLSLLDVGCYNLIDTYSSLLLNFRVLLEKMPDSFKGFYINSYSKLRTHPEIKDIDQQINFHVKDFYNSLRKVNRKNKTVGGQDGANYTNKCTND